MIETNIHIGNNTDAITVIDEVLTDIGKHLSVSKLRERLEKRLEALKYAIKRGVV